MSHEKTMVADRTPDSAVAEAPTTESLTLSVTSIDRDLLNEARKEQAGSLAATADSVPEFGGFQKLVENIGKQVLIPWAKSTVFATPETRAKQEQAQLKNRLAELRIEPQIAAERNKVIQGEIKNDQSRQKLADSQAKTEFTAAKNYSGLREKEQNSDIKQTQMQHAEVIKMLKLSFEQDKKLYEQLIENAPSPEAKFQIASDALKKNQDNQKILMDLASRMAGQVGTFQSPTAAAPTSGAPTGASPTDSTPTGSAPTGAAPPAAATVPAAGWTPSEPMPNSFSREVLTKDRPFVPVSYTSSGAERVGGTFKYDPFATRPAAPKQVATSTSQGEEARPKQAGRSDLDDLLAKEWGE